MSDVTVFKRSVSTRGLAAFAGEVLLISGSIVIALRLHSPDGVAAGLWWKAAFTAVLWQLCLYYNDFYDLTLVRGSRELVVRLLQAAGAASIILAALYVVVPALDLGSRVIVTSLCLFLVAVLTWRLLFNQVTGATAARGARADRRHRARRADGRPPDPSQHDFAYRVVGFIDDEPTSRRPGSARPGASGRRRTSLASSTSTRSTGSSSGSPTAAAGCRSQELLQAKLPGVRVEDATTTYERLTGKILIDRPQAELADLLRRLPRRRGWTRRRQARHRPRCSRWSASCSPRR